MYAVVAIKGHQYMVKAGDKIVVDAFGEEVGKKVALEEVLMSFSEDGSQVEIGEPFLKAAKVTATVQEHRKGDKVRVGKFQGKKRYHKTIWFRPQQTVLAIEEVKVHG